MHCVYLHGAVNMQGFVWMFFFNVPHVYIFIHSFIHTCTVGTYISQLYMYQCIIIYNIYVNLILRDVHAAVNHSSVFNVREEEKKGTVYFDVSYL